MTLHEMDMEDEFTVEEMYYVVEEARDALEELGRPADEFHTEGMLALMVLRLRKRLGACNEA